MTRCGLIPILLLAVLLFVTACTGTSISKSEQEDGDTQTDGDTDLQPGDIDGDETDGDVPIDGDVTPDGDITPDGDGPDGDDVPDGDGIIDGDAMPDGDVVPDGDDVPDGDGEDLCALVDCGQCQACNPTTGDCECSGACATEMYCDGIDDDCDDEIDEDGVCDAPSIRIELSWSLFEADLDLHVLRPGGIMGLPDYVDPNAVDFVNPNPDWGLRGVAADDPQFGNDIHEGGGEDAHPEVVTIDSPVERKLRVLVHYWGREGSGDTATQVWVKVYFNDTLGETFTVQMNNENSAWNVACIDVLSGSATAITNNDNTPQISVGDLDGIEHYACQQIGDACNSSCDCNPSANCTAGTCQYTDAPSIACCSAYTCPNGAACQTHTGEMGYCGLYTGFETDAMGADLDVRHNLRLAYLNWGMTFYTPRENAIVAVNDYEVSSGNSCATLDSNGTPWRGDINIVLFTPSTSVDELQPAETTIAVFKIADVRVENGIRVVANNTADETVVETLVSGQASDGQHTVRLVSNQPFHSIWITTENDPDFAIDDLQIGPLMAVE